MGVQTWTWSWAGHGVQTVYRRASSWSLMSYCSRQKLSSTIQVLDPAKDLVAATGGTLLICEVVAL